MKALNFFISQSEIPRNTHVSNSVRHRSARIAMSCQEVKSSGVLMLGAIECSLEFQSMPCSLLKATAQTSMFTSPLSGKGSQERLGALSSHKDHSVGAIRSLSKARLSMQEGSAGYIYIYICKLGALLPPIEVRPAYLSPTKTSLRVGIPRSLKL